MQIALLTVTIYLPWVHSLKEKRQVVKSLVEKISHKFRVSVVESGLQELHQSAEISIAFLTNDKNQGDSLLSHMVNYIEDHTEGEITSVTQDYR